MTCRSVALERRQEDDRRVPRAVALADQRGRLEPVHARHLDVHQDHGEVGVQDAHQGLLAGAGRHQVQAHPLEDGLQGQQVVRLVVHQQDVDLPIGLHGISLSVPDRARRPARPAGPVAVTAPAGMRPAHGATARFGSPTASTWSGVAVQPDAEHRGELLAADRLGQVVRRPGLEALLAVALHRLGRQRDDRQRPERLDAARIARIVS